MALEILDVNTLFGAYPSQHPDSTAESLVTALEAQQVQWCLTLSTVGLFHQDVKGNAATMQACRTLDRLIPVATLNPLNYWGQTDVIEQTVAQGFEMFRFFPHVQGWPLDFAPFRVMLSALAVTKRMPIMVSVRRPGDVSLAARIVDAYPHPVIFEGVSTSTLSEAIAVMQSNELIFLETHALHVPDGLPLLRDTVGVSRILFGSDAPGMSLAATLRYVQRSGLSEEDQAAILGTNAHHIWQSGEGS